MASKGKKSWLKRLGQVSVVTIVLALGLWVAVHRVQWLGPAIADGLRAVFGPAAVAWMEDVAYTAQDWVNRWRYKGEAPKTFWEPQKDLPTMPPPGLDGKNADGEPAFYPKPFAAPFPEVATSADGIWVPISDPNDKTAPIAMYKSMVHPDPRRGFAAIAVVAADLRAFDLHLVAGTREPASKHVAAADRTGLVPKEHARALFAAFNGGFKATHGHYGMKLGDVLFVPPRDIACTFVRLHDGAHRIGTWSKIKGDEAKMAYYRQTPPLPGRGRQDPRQARLSGVRQGLGRYRER